MNFISFLKQNMCFSFFSYIFTPKRICQKLLWTKKWYQEKEILFLFKILAINIFKNHHKTFSASNVSKTYDITLYTVTKGVVPQLRIYFLYNVNSVWNMRTLLENVELKKYWILYGKYKYIVAVQWKQWFKKM